MEANRDSKARAGILMRMLHIVYFLSREGETEQPHLFTVHHLYNNGVHLRDFKRWLSEYRGSEMPESFSWSYTRKYKNGYIWQDLAEDDLIIPVSGCEFVLKGSLLLSPIKTLEKKNDEKEEESLPTTSALKSKKRVTFKIEDNISAKPYAAINEESSVEAIASTSSSTSETQRAKDQRCEEIIPKGNGRQFNGSRKWASVLRKFLTCRTVETKDSVRRAKSNQSDCSSSHAKREEGRRKSFFFCNHV